MISVKVTLGGSITLRGKKAWHRIDVNAIADGRVLIGIDSADRRTCTPGNRGLTVRVKPAGVRVVALELDGDAVVLGIDCPRSMRVQEGVGQHAAPPEKRHAS